MKLLIQNNDKYTCRQEVMQSEPGAEPTEACEDDSRPFGESINYKLFLVFFALFFPFFVSSCKSFGLFSISHFLLSSDSSSVSVGLPSSYSLVKNRFKVFELRTDVLQLSRTTYLHFSAVRDSANPPEQWIKMFLYTIENSSKILME